MSDIDEIARRIHAALDRVAYRIEKLDGGGGGDAGALQAALENERAANAQLEARVAAIKERQETTMAQLQEQVSGQAAQLAALGDEIQRLRKANAQLRDNNRLLREANEAGGAEPHLINKAMLSELEALRAARGAETAELEAILSALGPLLEPAMDAANEETV